MAKIRTHEDLEVYKMAFAAAMEIYALSKSFPKEERFALTDQIRRSSRSVCSNTAEAFRKRRYPAAFVAKINDAEGEGAETQVWLDFAFKCGYIVSEDHHRLKLEYDRIIGKLVRMANHPEQWVP